MSLVCWMALAVTCMGAQENGLKVTPRAEQSGFFGGSQVRLSYRITAVKPLQGVLRWTYAASGRTIARGEVPVMADGDKSGDVAISLTLPPVREGVILATQLRAVVHDTREESIGEHEQTLWLFPEDPFVHRRQWLEKLNLTLYDPEGRTKEVFDEAKIPYHAPRSAAALEAIEEGILVVGEGVSLKAHRGLAETMARLAARGVPVLCLAASDGELAFPASDGPEVRSIALRRNDVIRDLDKRLDDAYWPPEGKVVKSGLLVVSDRAQVVMQVSEAPAAWPWREVEFQGGARWVVCGFGLIESWNEGPTPRFLLANILEQLTRKQSYPSPLSSEER